MRATCVLVPHGTGHGHPHVSSCHLRRSLRLLRIPAWACGARVNARRRTVRRARGRPRARKLRRQRRVGWRHCPRPAVIVELEWQAQLLQECEAVRRHAQWWARPERLDWSARAVAPPAKQDDLAAAPRLRHNDGRDASVPCAARAAIDAAGSRRCLRPRAVWCAWARRVRPVHAARLWRVDWPRAYLEAVHARGLRSHERGRDCEVAHPPGPVEGREAARAVVGHRVQPPELRLLRRRGRVLPRHRTAALRLSPRRGQGGGAFCGVGARARPRRGRVAWARRRAWHHRRWRHQSARGCAAAELMGGRMGRDARTRDGDGSRLGGERERWVGRGRRPRPRWLPLRCRRRAGPLAATCRRRRARCKRRLRA
jgi:hypothetical protein